MTKKKKNETNHHDGQQRHHQQTIAGQSNSSPPPGNNPHCKKRKRSQRTTDGDAILSITPHVMQWLEKRKKKIPDALLKATTSEEEDGGAASIITIDRVLCLLPSLRERERRALVRHVEKCISNQGSCGGDGNNNNNSQTAKNELEGSDGEYDIHDDAMSGLINNSNHQGSSITDNWPANIQFSNNYQWDPKVPPEIKNLYFPPNGQKIRQRSSRHSNRVYFQRITDPNHPAHGEFGLYCALPHARPGMWLLDYVGRVMLGEDQDKESDYVSDFGEKSELACDANSYGNEARFLNDFRNTGKHPNVEFNTRRDKNGELRQGVYVKLEKDARQEGFDGVRQHEELLVSYGKSYWRSRVGNLTDFVWRLPGQPLPDEGKPAAANNCDERKDK
ncbi:hypothetical protein ACHAXR_010240 [Thalassiosira sp. AJA248-18]